MSQTSKGSPHCVLPYIHLDIHSDGRVRPCCKFDGSFGHLSESSLTSILKSPQRRALLNEVVSDIWPLGCVGCKEVENQGGQSLRMDMNRHFTIQKSQDLSSLKISSVEVRLSNLCNLSCRYCGPSYSSKWESLLASQSDLAETMTDLGALNVKALVPSLFLPAVIQFINNKSNKVQLITLTGGEPLIQKDHYHFLDSIEGRAHEITLDYTTNLTRLHLKKNSLVEHWSRFAGVTLRVSIDGTKDVYEYIRVGGRFSDLIENIAAVKKSLPVGSLRMSGTFTCSLYNITRIVETIQLYNSLGLLFHSTLLKWPEFLRASELPIELKHQVEENWKVFSNRLEEDKSWTSDAQWSNVAKKENIARIRRFGQSCIQYMKGSYGTDGLQKFSRFTAALDRTHGTRFRDVYPEFEKYIKY